MCRPVLSALPGLFLIYVKDTPPVIVHGHCVDKHSLAAPGSNSITIRVGRPAYAAGIFILCAMSAVRLLLWAMPSGLE